MHVDRSKKKHCLGQRLDICQLAMLRELASNSLKLELGVGGMHAKLQVKQGLSRLRDASSGLGIRERRGNVAPRHIARAALRKLRMVDACAAVTYASADALALQQSSLERLAAIFVVP